MMVNIMRAFRTRIGSLKWLDQQTIAQAQNKIDLMIAMIAYPDLTFNDTLLNKFYSELTVSADDFASNLYYYLGFEVKTNLSQLRQPANLWTMVPAQFDPLEVQASYYPSLNQICTFSTDSWAAYLGMRLLTALITMDDESLTLGENIADNGGLISSYTAYQTARNNGGFIPQLPGLNYTDDQLFFIAFGQCYCGYVTPSSIQNQILMKNDHSPGPLRVLGPAMNSNEFAAAFKCPAYVQKGENDICDDGKEIAEAEDWESTVKENRSSLHPCLIHPISLHNFSTVISSPSVNNTLDSYQRVWGPSIGTILLRHRLQEQGEPSLPVFIRQRVSENRIGIALQAVHPDYHRIRLNGASRILNPQPYRAAYFGEKLHNEKLVMFGVTHICAIDGYSGKIVQFVSMPVKNPVQIYQHLFRPILVNYGLFDQIRVDHSKEWTLSLFVQESLAHLRHSVQKPPHRQTSSTLERAFQMNEWQMLEQGGCHLKLSLMLISQHLILGMIHWLEGIA
eukprot:Em0001g104a